MDIKKIQSQKNNSGKGKLFIILGIVLVAFLAVLLFFFFSGDDGGDESKKLDVKNLKEIVYVSKDKPYTVDLVDYKANKTITSLDLSKYKTSDEDSVHYMMNDNYNVLYVVVGNKLLSVSKTDEGLKEKTILEDEKLLNTSNLFINDEKLLISLKNSNELLRFNTSTNQFLESVNVNGDVLFATEIKDNVYYVVNNELVKYDVKEKTQDSSVGLIDVPTDMKVTNDNLYVLSPFGAGLDNSLLLRIDLKDMLVETLIELEAGQSKFISEYRYSDFVYVATKNQSDEFGIKTYSTQKVMSEEKVEKTNYFLENSKEINGLILSYNENSLNINGMKDKEISYKLKVNEPVYYNVMK